MIGLLCGKAAAIPSNPPQRQGKKATGRQGGSMDDNGVSARLKSIIITLVLWPRKFGNHISCFTTESYPVLYISPSALKRAIAKVKKQEIG